MEKILYLVTLISFCVILKNFKIGNHSNNQIWLLILFGFVFANSLIMLMIIFFMQYNYIKFL